MSSSRHGHSPHKQNFTYRKSSSCAGTEDGSKKQPLTHDSSRGNVSSLFIEDYTGDRRNLEYGPDRYAIPRFHSAGKGALLGLNRRYRITARSETRREVEDIEVDSTRRSRKGSLLSTIDTGDGHPAKIVGHHGIDEDFQHDYISFENFHRRKRRRVSRSSEAGFSGDDESYGSSSSPEREQMQSSTFDTFKNDPIHQQYIRLSKATTDHPHDAQVWLDFISHQNLTFGVQNSQAPGSASSRSLIDLKISLYEKALESVEDQDGKKKLILGLMHEGRKIWDAQKQTSQWQSVFDQYPSFDLWKLYLNFKQTNAVEYSSEDCLKVYRRFLKISQAQEPSLARDRQCIYVLLRLSLYLWQTDSTELAIGLWQALLELCFCSPAGQPGTKLLASFEEFWNSEAARIGEDGASGWTSGHRAEVKPRTDKRMQNIEDISLHSWPLVESEFMLSEVLPARTLDETNNEDPFRIVLFSDIKEFLLFSPTTGEGGSLLLDAFLLFLGLDPASSLSESQQWQIDPFIYSHPASLEDSHFSEAVANKAGRMPTENSDISGLKSEGTSLAQAILSSATNLPTSLCPDFVRRALFQLTYASVGSCHRNILMRYVVELEASFDIKSARKQAKSFLKHQPDSLRLYNTYALLEYRLGNLDVAERVWSTALSMQASLTSENESIAFSVWRDYVWSLMHKRLFRRAALLLTKISEAHVDLSQDGAREMTPAITAQIKTGQFIKTKIDAYLFGQDPRELVALIDLLAFHKYLNSNSSLELALDVYSQYLAVIASLASKIGLRVIERIHERRAILIHTHTTAFGAAFQPKLLASTLASSVQEFPNNLNLLQLHHFYAQRSGVLDRLHQFDLESHTQDWPIQGNDSVTRDLFDVSVELDRPSYSGSTDHSIRSAFQRATKQGSSGACCVNLWRTYILWEVSVCTKVHQGTKIDFGSRARALKEVYHMALRACPWSKELFMLAFTDTTLRSCLGEHELKQIYHSMVERGLRLRIDISDRVE